MNNKTVNFFKIPSTDLSNLSIKEGQIIFTTDTCKLYLDINSSPNGRIQIEGADFSYGLSIDGRSLSIAKNDGSSTVTLPADTTYTFEQDATDGHKIIITPSTGGQAITLIIPDNDTIYSAGNGINLNGTTFSNAGVRQISTGSTNGTISVNTNGIASEVAVAGLGNLAYENSLTASDVNAISITAKGFANGVAELDTNGKVPSSQLPSYVDDVEEYADLAHFPVTGESGKIYIAEDTNLTYRWSGSGYVTIASDLALGETASTAYRGDRGSVAYTHAVTNKGSAFASGLYKIATNAEGHVTGATNVTKSDITNLGVLGDDDITVIPVANTGASIGTIEIGSDTYNFKLPAQVGNEVRIGSTQPSDNDWKIWIDSDEVINMGSEIVNEYSTSTINGYSASFINQLHTYSTTKTRIGTYKDKDLYRILLEGTISQTTTDIGTLTAYIIKDVINFTGTLLKATGKRTQIPMYKSSTDFCNLDMDQYYTITITVPSELIGSRYSIYVDFTEMNI